MLKVARKNQRNFLKNESFAKYFVSEWNFCGMCWCDLIKWLLCFRYKLEEQEQDIENLEQKLERILKLATASCDSGRQFVVNQRWVMQTLISCECFPSTHKCFKFAICYNDFTLNSQTMNHLFNWIQLRYVSFASSCFVFFCIEFYIVSDVDWLLKHDTHKRSSSYE